MADPDVIYYDIELDTPHDWESECSLIENANTLLQYVYSGFLGDEDCTDHAIDTNSIVRTFMNYLTQQIEHRYDSNSVYYRYHLFKSDLVYKAIELLRQAGYQLHPREVTYVEKEIFPCISSIAAYYFEDF